MKRSTDRILTTHVGSLIRPPALQDFLRAKQGGQPFDHAAYAKYLTGSIAAFLTGKLQLFQVLYARSGAKNVPWTRAHVYAGHP